MLKPVDELPLHVRIAELARTLQEQNSAQETVDSIARLAADWLGEDSEAGISLVHHHYIETVAATAEFVTHGDTLQYQLREGPCLDAAWQHEQVHSPRLLTDERWPVWGPRIADECGVESMLCTRLFTNETTLGALNLYSKHLDAFDRQTREEAIAISAQAAVALAAARQVGHLHVAVDHRTTIGKALGILIERFDISDDRAMHVLRRLSSDQNRKLYDIAVELVATRSIPSDPDASGRSLTM